MSGRPPSAHRIAVIPGDGIGKEVVPAAMAVLDAVAARFQVGLEWTVLPWSCRWYLETSRMMPKDGLAQLAGYDAVFLGAVGDPAVPDHISLWGLLIPIRRHFRQYVNLRPVRLLPGIRSPLADPGPVDLCIVRENNEGEYSEIGGRLYRGGEDELAVQEAVFTSRGVDRVLRFAFELARTRRGRLTSATKSNGIVHTMPLWDERVALMSARYPDVTVEECHIDALAAYFVQRPSSFDVVVASNLFGDILSDLAAAVAGSIGIAPSANLDPERRHPSMFEPVHGSAPDIAGKGVANPTGQLLTGAMMLDHLGHPDAARAVEAAVEAVLRQPRLRTPDLGGEARTEQVVDAVLAQVGDATETGPAPGRGP